MNHNDDLFRQLESYSDSQLSELALRSKVLTLKSPLVVQCRYIGPKKMAPGLPLGLQKGSDGQYFLGHVAIVRIQPNDAAANLSTYSRKWIIGVIALGLICIMACITFGLLFRQGPDHARVSFPGSPCLVAYVDDSSVSCLVDGTVTRVPIGKSFPNSQYTLLATSSTSRSFTAISGKQQFLFQLGDIAKN
jgi:hypothetical protein